MKRRFYVMSEPSGLMSESVARARAKDYAGKYPDQRYSVLEVVAEFKADKPIIKVIVKETKSGRS